MAGNFSIDVLGLPGVTATLDKILGALNTRDILDESGAILFNRLRTRFIQETDPDGNRWVQSAAARHRARTGAGGGTLYDTGRLFHSLQLSALNANESSIGTDVQYAAFNNVHRVFLGFGDEDLNVAQRLVIKRIEQALS
jgi:phage gpG-like protein